MRGSSLKETSAHAEKLSSCDIGAWLDGGTINFIRRVFAVSLSLRHFPPSRLNAHYKMRIFRIGLDFGIIAAEEVEE